MASNEQDEVKLEMDEVEEKMEIDELPNAPLTIISVSSRQIVIADGQVKQEPEQEEANAPIAVPDDQAPDEAQPSLLDEPKPEEPTESEGNQENISIGEIILPAPDEFKPESHDEKVEDEDEDEEEVSLEALESSSEESCDEVFDMLPTIPEGSDDVDETYISELANASAEIALQPAGDNEANDRKVKAAARKLVNDKQSNRGELDGAASVAEAGEEAVPAAAGPNDDDGPAVDDELAVDDGPNSGSSEDDDDMDVQNMKDIPMVFKCICVRAREKRLRKPTIKRKFISVGCGNSKLDDVIEEDALEDVGAYCEVSMVVGSRPPTPDGTKDVPNADGPNDNASGTESDFTEFERSVSADQETSSECVGCAPEIDELKPKLFLKDVREIYDTLIEEDRTMRTPFIYQKCLKTLNQKYGPDNCDRRMFIFYKSFLERKSKARSITDSTDSDEDFVGPPIKRSIFRLKSKRHPHPQQRKRRIPTRRQSDSAS